MIVELALIIIIIIMIITEFIKYVMPSVSQRVRGECPCNTCVKKYGIDSVFRRHMPNDSDIKEPFDEKVLFKYNMNNQRHRLT
jgi:hypothetical protein